MHRSRKQKHRKPFFSSSSDEDDIDDNPTSMKWKPIVPSFPMESNRSKRNNRSIERSPLIDSLNTKMTNQQKLSAEIIQKEEIYNQAEMEANKKMFGCANPGRCLSKDEIKRRKDIILQIVNSKLKSKLSELMGEFGERIGMDDTYENGRLVDDDGDQSADDDDSIPEAPPPPTFNTSSESSNESGDDLDRSFTKEFELYEKEIKEKTASSTQSNVASTSIVNPTTSTTSSMFSLSSINQKNWLQPIQQWTDVTPWIPPVGPPQVMDPFPPPIESEQMSYINPPPLFAAFANVNNQWTDPATTFTNPPPTTFAPNYNAVPQYSNTEWMNKPQSIPSFTPATQIQSFINHPPPIVKWNPIGQTPPNSFVPSAKVQHAETVVRPNQAYLTPNHGVNGSIVSKSKYINSNQSVEQKVATTNTVGSEPKVEQANKKNPSDGNWNKFNEKINNDLHSRKRPYEQKIYKIEPASKNSQGNANSNKNSNQFGKPKKTRFDHPKNDQKQTDYRLNGRNDRGTESVMQDEPSGIQATQSHELNARYEKINMEARKFLSNFRNTKNQNIDTPSGGDDRSDQTNPPIEWRKLCDIVDKLLDISPNALKDLPSNDRRVQERNEILMILSDNPRNFYAHINEYGENNVKWAVKMAQRILRPQGRYNDKIALTIAPFQRAIYVAMDRSKVSSLLKQEPIPKNTTKSTTPVNHQIPKEWKKLCEIVDKVLDIPTRVIEKLPTSDIRVKQRNDILMLLSNDPEGFLLHDEKYGAHNVDSAILAAKRILYPDGVLDERVQKVMLRQREILTNEFFTSSAKRSISKDRESSRKRFNNKSATNGDEHRSRSLPQDIPKEWNQLCEIVDKVLDTPKEIRIKMSKRDPRWEQRDALLLLLTDNPDKLESQAEDLGRVNVEWAIKSAKKVLYQNGLKDRTIFKKLSPQRKLLLRNSQTKPINDGKCVNENKVTRKETSRQAKNDIEKPTVQTNDLNVDLRKIADGEHSTTKGTKEKSSDENIKTETKHVNGDDQTSKIDKNITQEPQTNKDNHLTATKSKSEKTTAVIATDKVIDEKEAWSKLCNIVDKLLDLPRNAADKLDSSDKRLIERNDILMILSDDPENFSKFDGSYGSANVAWAIKSAKKLIYSNGKRNEKLADALWKQRDIIMCAEESPKEDAKDGSSTGDSNEWICIRKIATKVFLLSCKSKKLTKEQLHQQVELLLQLSNDPDVVRSKPICKKIGEGRVEVAIAKCKHITDRMRKFDPKALVNFENLRSKMVLYSESLNQSKNIKNYNVILAEVRTIVDDKLFNEMYGPNFNKWTMEQKLERNELAILLIKDPLLLKSNEKYMEMVRSTGKVAMVDGIIADVEKCLKKCEYAKEAPVEVCPPIITKINDEKFMVPFKQKKLIQRIHRLIEQFLVDPKPEVFDVCSNSDGTIDVVCANAMTFDWLKKSINELDGLWNSAKLSISKPPITRKVLDSDDLKEIKMMLKTVPPTPFAEAMKQLKKSNSKLKTDKWQLIPSSFSDPKKMFVMVDLMSLIELERSKREINVESGTIYFDIQYVGKDNF